jgi:hypothetical protein
MDKTIMSLAVLLNRRSKIIFVLVFEILCSSFDDWFRSMRSASVLCKIGEIERCLFGIRFTALLCRRRNRLVILVGEHRSITVSLTVNRGCDKLSRAQSGSGSNSGYDICCRTKSGKKGERHAIMYRGAKIWAPRQLIRTGLGLLRQTKD